MKNWKKFFGMLGALICALGLNAMEFKSNPNVIAELEYFYAKDGTITGFTYDKANQLVSSTVDGKTIDYRYDGVGRLVQEGNKTYQYGYLDKILNVLENGETITGFDYHMDGQIASVRRTATLPAQASADASGAGETIENFLWDGLALIHRGGTNYINEPAVTGGNPILADGNVLFNDMLGTTLGVKSGESFNQIAMTAFGETENKEAMFTGKPYIGELGDAFLFRNYRADQGKWQTQDPLGYPDGWNNLAYVNNEITTNIDNLGLCSQPGCASTTYVTEKQDLGFLSEVTASCGEKEEKSGVQLISLSVDVREAFGEDVTSLVFHWRAVNDLRSHPTPHSGEIALVFHSIMSWRVNTTAYACGMESKITLSHGAVMETVIDKKGKCIHE